MGWDLRRRVIVVAAAAALAAAGFYMWGIDAGGGVMDCSQVGSITVTRH